MNESEAPLPEMNDAMLSASEVAQLFADLDACAEGIHITVKAGMQRAAPDDSIDLHEARRLLQSGAVRGVQIRYRHRGEAYCDTLMPGPAGVRLVRIRQQ